MKRSERRREARNKTKNQIMDEFTNKFCLKNGLDINNLTTEDIAQISSAYMCKHIGVKYEYRTIDEVFKEKKALIMKNEELHSIAVKYCADKNKNIENLNIDDVKTVCGRFGLAKMFI